MAFGRHVRPPREIALTIRSLRSGDMHVIGLAGELDLVTAWRLEQELLRVERSDVRTIAVDLRKLTFIDSTGMHLIIQAEKRAGLSAHHLILIRPRGAIQRHFELCGLASELPFVDSLASDAPSAGASGAPFAPRRPAG